MAMLSNRMRLVMACLLDASARLLEVDRAAVGSKGQLAWCGPAKSARVWREHLQSSRFLVYDGAGGGSHGDGGGAMAVTVRLIGRARRGTNLGCLAWH